MGLKEAVETLIQNLKTDEGYRQSWQANIAMAFKDAYIEDKSIHDIAHEASNNFLDMLCNIKPQ